MALLILSCDCPEAHNSFLSVVIQSVELQGGPTAEIKIKANIVEQVLEVLGVPHSNAIQCVNFGCVYFGTSKMEEVILHNKSPEPVDWVAVLMDNAVGGEMVSKLLILGLLLNTYLFFSRIPFPLCHT